MTDSLDLDKALESSEPDAPRWDYWLGTTKPGADLVAVEVHPATDGDVKVVIAKKRWAVAKAAQHLRSGARIKRWCWVASGRTAFTKNTRGFRSLAKAGIELVGSRLRIS